MDYSLRDTAPNYGVMWGVHGFRLWTHGPLTVRDGLPSKIACPPSTNGQ